MSTEQDRAPWDRQPGETVKAYLAFCTYRDLGPDRNLRAAWRRHVGDARATANLPGHVARWSSEHRWPARAAAYDLHTERLQRLEAERIRTLRIAEKVETQWDLGQQLAERAKEMLKYPLVQQELDRDGQTVIVKPARWKLVDAPRMAEVAARLQGLATGQPTDIQALTSGDGGPLEVDGLPDLSGLSDDQLAQLRQLLQIARAARPPRGGSERDGDEP